MNRNSQRIALAAGVLLSAVFAWLALQDVSWTDLRAAFALARLWLAVPLLLLFALFYWLKAARWRQLLAPTAAIPTRVLVPSLVVGFAANNILPVHLGDLVRVYLLGRERGLAKSMVLGTVVLERLFDLLAVLVLALVALAGGIALSPELRAAGIILAAIGAAALVPVVLLVIREEWFIRLSDPLLAPLQPALRARLHRQIVGLASGFGALRASHRLPLIIANSLVQWALLAGCVWIAITAFGLVVPWVAAVLILVLIVAGITLPAGPGYVGTIEYCFVLGLKVYGISAGAALSVGLFYHALTWVSMTVAGAYFLRRYGLGWRSLRRAAAQS